MELMHDWRGFQSLFLSHREKTGVEKAAAVSGGPIYLILSGKVIVCAYGENEDLTDWLGATEDELRLAMPERDIIVFEKQHVDEWMEESLSLNHVFDQAQFFKTKAKSQLSKLSKSKSQMSPRKHFLLYGIQSWWLRVFPSTYGMYFEIEGGDTPSLLVVIQRGQVHSFHPPDLSTLTADRRKQPMTIVKYLSDRYLIPIQGIFATAEEWKLWSESENPWPQIFSAIRGNREKLAPYKWSLVGLIAMRAYFGI